MTLSSDFLGENTGLYFFSAVFQGNMALLALVGVFVVFKIQQLSSSILYLNDIIIRYIRDRLSLKMQPGYSEPFICDYKNGVPDIDSALDYYQKGHPLFDEAQKLKKDSEVRRLYDEARSYGNQKSYIIKKMKLPLYFIITTIIISLICLPMIRTIHFRNNFWEILLIAIVILLNVITLLANCKFIMYTVKNS